jgi:ribonuclease T1
MASSGSVLRQAMRKWRVAAVVASGLVVGAASISAVEARPVQSPAAQPTVTLAILPAQAQTTYRLILSGGPFPYSKDGSAFGNRERQLPPRARGYYREYTVKTPHARDRGGRRIICGGVPPTRPAACFYTDDHYASFRRIEP